MKVGAAGNGNQKLTHEKVNEIRQRYTDGASQQSLAKDFDVSQMMISNIVNYRIWKDTALNEHAVIIESNSRQIRDLKSKNTKLEKKVADLEEWQVAAERAIKSQQLRITQLEAQINE